MSKWKIYKNYHPIGEEKTWHKSLSVLMRDEGITEFSLKEKNGFITIKIIGVKTIYEIIREE